MFVPCFLHRHHHHRYRATDGNRSITSSVIMSIPCNSFEFIEIFLRGGFTVKKENLLFINKPVCISELW